MTRRPKSRASLLISATLIPLIPACINVVEPSGFNSLKQSAPPALIVATRGHAYGHTPTSYDLPDGRSIKIKVHEHTITSGMGAYRAQLRYDLELGTSSLSCATTPYGPNTPKTRFGCWSTTPHETLSLWIAPGEDCGAQDLEAMATLTDPICWLARLETPADRYTLALGYVAQWGSPIDQLTWTNSSGATVQASDSVQELTIKLWQTPAARRSKQEQDRLILSALAMHFWLHGQRPS